MANSSFKRKREKRRIRKKRPPMTDHRINNDIHRPMWKETGRRSNTFVEVHKRHKALQKTAHAFHPLACVARANQLFMPICSKHHTCPTFNFGLLTLNCFKLIKFLFILPNKTSTKHQKFPLILQYSLIKTSKTNYHVKS